MNSDTNKLDGLNDGTNNSGAERKVSNFILCLYSIQIIRFIEQYNRLLRRVIHKFVKSQGFYWLVIVLVFLNTLVLASEYHKQPNWLDKFQCKSNFKVKNLQSFCGLRLGKFVFCPFVHN